MTPLVSIITPSYNQAAFLENTIRSVLGQDYGRIEYLIVDGGSTDNSPEIIRRYADRLAWWVSEPDSGQAAALGKGFARASGQIVAWLNSDDMYAPGAVSRAVAALERYPQAGLVYADAISIDAAGRPLYRQSFDHYDLADLAAFQIICQPAVFLRRAALQQAGGIDPHYHYLLDHQLWLRIAARGEIRYVPEIWAYPRYHASAKNLTGGPAFGREAYRIVDWMAQDALLRTRFSSDRRRIRAAADRFNARYLLDAGQAGAALQGYLRSARTHLPTALGEWRRMAFAALSMLGLGGLGGVYYRLRPRPALGVESVHYLYD